MTISDVIRLALTNIPAITFLAALLIAAMRPTHGPAAERYLAWLLLLAVGVNGIWAGLFHVLFPQTAAAFIGWQVSPFQFEIGVADIALGITAVLSFWRPLGFQTGIATFAALFYVGVAIGHVRQAVFAGNFAPGNMGILFFITIAMAALLIALPIIAERAQADSARPRRRSLD